MAKRAEKDMREKDKTALEIGPRFVQETSYYDFLQTGRRQGEPQPIPFWTAEKGMETVLLPPWQQALPSSCLWTVMEKRRSRRTYAEEALEIQALSCLCGVTQGIEKEIVFNGNATLRPVPSAGAKHAIETIVLVRRVKGLAPGLYRYLAKEHALGWLGETTSDWLCALDTAFTSNRFQHNSAVTFFWICSAGTYGLASRPAWIPQSLFGCGAHRAKFLLGGRGPGAGGLHDVRF